jgi:hypothetical protein
MNTLKKQSAASPSTRTLPQNSPIPRTLIIDSVPCYVVPLPRGNETIIHKDDIELLLRWPWRERKDRKTWYVYRMDGPKMIHLHNVICPPPNGLQTDHKNGNGLDNRRSNLRVATNAQNQQNRINLNNGKKKSSVFRGVCWWDKSWRADIGLDGKNKYLGRFRSEVEAAHAYDLAAVRYFGEFARPNFACFA